MRKKKIIIAFLVFIGAAAITLLWPFTSYDIDRVLPDLRDLKMPYQTVGTGYYLDGGSIGITIVDRDSRKLELALPVSTNRSYPRLFIGARNASESEAIEVTFSDDTRQMLISIIEKHHTSDDNSDIALVALRGAPRDHLRSYINGVVRYFQNFGN